jgi:L-threonylcarbamoyladenylate synthase
MGIRPADKDSIAEAAKLLKQGELVAFPTETVYGLGADARNGEAVAAIFEVKGRPQFNPLIVHIADLQAAEHLVEFNDLARTLARHFWPGALTLVLPKKLEGGLNDLVSAGLETIALRAPSHPIAQQLIREAGIPIAAPSANKSGHISPTTAEHVYSDLGETPALILDAGPTGFGIESTVVAIQNNDVTLLRPGAVTADDLQNLLSRPLLRTDKPVRAPQSPGQLESHYAPRARLRLNATDIRNCETLLAFGTPELSGAPNVINLSKKGDLREAASNLFSALRQLDASGAEAIAVMPIPESGLGEAINDRLRRAAAPKP